MAPDHSEAAKAVPKAHFSAQILNLFPKMPDNIPKQIGPHMRLMLPENILRCPCLYEGAHNIGPAGIVGSRGQFSIGKSPCPPLSKLNIGGGIQIPALPKCLHILHTLFQRLSAL